MFHHTPNFLSRLNLSFLFDVPKNPFSRLVLLSCVTQLKTKFFLSAYCSSLQLNIYHQHSPCVLKQCYDYTYIHTHTYLVVH